MDYDAVGKHAGGLRVKYACGDHVELELPIGVHDGVTCVVAAAVPDYKVGILREEIDDFSFTFVAPLGADDCYYWHLMSFRIRCRFRAVGEYNTGAPLPPPRHTIFSIRGCYVLLEVANPYSFFNVA